MTLLTHIIAFLVGCGAGYYLHFKFGSRIAADVNQIRQMKP